MLRKAKLSMEREDASNWPIHEKIEEWKAKIALKQRCNNAFEDFCRQLIDQNDDKLQNLRFDNKNNYNLFKFFMNADSNVIKAGYARDRETRLAMARRTCDSTIAEQVEKILLRIRKLNQLRFDCMKRLQKIDNLTTQTRHLDGMLALQSVEPESQRIRVLVASLDKMDRKYRSAHYIQHMYKQIREHIQNDNLLLPGKLDSLEKTLKRNQQEIDNELMVTLRGTLKPLQHAKKMKEQLEMSMRRAKRKRDQLLVGARRTSKTLAQEVAEAREYKQPKRKGIPKNPNEVLRMASSLKGKDKRINASDVVLMFQSSKKKEQDKMFWEKIREFWETKRALDDLQSYMCLDDVSSISVFFQNQLERNCTLKKNVKSLVESKNLLCTTLEVVKRRLATTKREKESALEIIDAETGDLRAKLEHALVYLEDIRGLSTQKRVLVLHVSNAIDLIRQKIEMWDRTLHQVAFQLGNEDVTNNLESMIATGIESIPPLDAESPEDAMVCLYLCAEKLMKYDKITQTLAAKFEEENQNMQTKILQEQKARFALLLSREDMTNSLAVTTTAAMNAEIARDSSTNKSTFHPFSPEDVHSDEVQERLASLRARDARFVQSYDNDLEPDFFVDADDWEESFVSREMIKMCTKSPASQGGKRGGGRKTSLKSSLKAKIKPKN